MTASKHTAWLAPAVFSFPAWLSHARDEFVLHTQADRVPINATQSLLLWQTIIDRDVFVGEPQVAQLAQRAWRQIHEYCIDLPHRWPALMLSEDSRHFKDWAQRYQSKCDEQGVIDEWAFAARLPALIAAGMLELPEQIELVGFDLPLTPLQEQIVAALQTACSTFARHPTPTITPPPLLLQQFTEADQELHAAATWAREHLAHNAGHRIAVVVPDLSVRLQRVERQFRRVFDAPGFALGSASPEPWHISMGKPLADWPLANDALAVLALSHNRMTQPQASRLLRSPFFANWPTEHNNREQVLIKLAQRAPYDLTITELEWALRQSDAADSADTLAAWRANRSTGASLDWPSQWASRFQQELTHIGFGRGRSLNSVEYQVMQRWHDMLEDLSGLDTVCAEPMARSPALDLLRERARSTVFREQNPGVPVEVLGVEEALGSAFDAMWITTLDSDTWPAPPRRDALIPAPLQAQIPQSSAEGCLQRAHMELVHLRTAAPIVHASFALGSEEIALQASGLLADCRIEPAAMTAPPNPADMQSPENDDLAPAFPGGHARGGTGVLQDQSGCPFKAFAQRRLNAANVAPPRPGLDPRQRGTLIHRALEFFWADLDGQADLIALVHADLARRVHQAVQHALQTLTRDYRLALSAAGQQLEEQRLERLLHSWLDVELGRSEFSVVGREQDITLRFDNLELGGKVDRIDALAGSGTLLIDYKSGRTSKSGWRPDPRIADPQLPAYAVSMQPTPSAIAFARLRPGELRFDGLANGDLLTEGITDLATTGNAFRDLESWEDLLEHWRGDLKALAGEFTNGNATVDPLNAAQCRNCHLHGLCRIYERAPYQSLTDQDEDE